MCVFKREGCAGRGRANVIKSSGVATRKLINHCYSQFEINQTGLIELSGKKMIISFFY